MIDSGKLLINVGTHVYVYVVYRLCPISVTLRICEILRNIIVVRRFCIQLIKTGGHQNAQLLLIFDQFSIPRILR